MRMVPSGVTTTSQGMNFVGGFPRPSISIGGGNLRTIVPSAVDGDEKFFALPLEKFESMTSDQSLPEAADKGAVLVEDQEGVGGLIGDERDVPVATLRQSMGIDRRGALGSGFGPVEIDEVARLLGSENGLGLRGFRRGVRERSAVISGKGKCGEGEKL